jgi:hypothetical protein
MNTLNLKLVLIEKDGNAPTGMEVGDTIDVTLDASRPVTIGREPTVDLCIPVRTVGRRVVRLYLAPDGLWVEDLGSGGSSSLEINGVLTLRPHCHVPDKAVLRIGPVGFRVELQ